MLFPQTAYLEGVVGATWEATFNVYSDAGETVPLDLSTIYDVTQVTLEMDGVVELTTANGLTITPGVITATIPATATASAPSASAWRLKLVRLDGGTDFLFTGTCSWVTP